ncbi:hypothetical protein BOX15_Mlig028731g1, partial [Macrostomum lignano]
HQPAIMDYSGADSSFTADMAEGGAPATINMEKLRRIQATIPVQDPNAPLGSNKNPIRIIQQGNRFITTQNLSEEQLSQITQVLHNQSIMSEVQKPSGTPAGRAGLSPNSKSLLRDLDNTGASPAGVKRRRGKRLPEEEDPDFDPIAEEEGRKPGRYLYPDDSIIFQCDRCDLQFMSRQALLKHVQLRHEQRDARRTQYVPVRKRSALKAAVKTSTDEELVDICLPRLAKLANPFDFLLVKSERGDPPLPNLAMLVDDLVNLVDISRKFLKEHLVRIPTGEPRPLGSVCIDSQAKADILGVEAGSYTVRPTFNEGYLPPRHRASLQSRRSPGAAAAAVSQAQQDLAGGQASRFATLQPHPVEPDVVTSVGGSGVQTDTSAGSFSMKIGPKSTQIRQQSQRQPAITDKDIAVERYYQVLDENGQPSDFVIEVATGQFFNRITGEQIAVMQESADLAEQPAGAVTLAATSSAGAVTVTGVAGASPSKASAGKGSAATAAEEVSSDVAAAAKPDAGAAKDAADKNGAVDGASEAKAAVGGGDNAQAAASGANAEQPTEGDAAAAAPEAAVDGQHAAVASAVAADTGEAVQIDLSAMFPGVTLQDLDDTVLLITKPDGSTLQVEHGGQGITLEFLQELLNTQFD